MSNAVKIVRALAYTSGVKPHRIFNDRLKDGTRSVKVLGWELRDYDRAMVVLRAAGINSMMVKRPKPYEGYRLWID